MSDVRLIKLSNDFRCYAPTDPDGKFLELNFIFSEVFNTDTYKNDVSAVPINGVVLDIGANVGMFSFLVKSRKPDATVLAFEPMPITLEALRKNIELHDLTGVTVYPVALGAKEEASVEFTYYPMFPGNSTRYPEQKGTLLAPHGTTVEVPVTTVSSVLAHHPELTFIDLVKIDVEGAEEDVLAGITPQDWARIRSFVIEIEDADGQLTSLQKILGSHGYAVTTNRAPMIPEIRRMYIVHASRRGPGSPGRRDLS